MSALGKMTGDTRRCVFCGKYMAAHLTQCPFCREAVPQVQLSRRAGPNGGEKICRGFLYMLLGDAFYYFSCGYGKTYQVALPSLVFRRITQFSSSLLFPVGLSVSLY